jgi:alpha-galactosidase
VIPLQLAPRSVRVFRIVQASLPPAAPGVQVHASKNAEVGQAIQFSAEADASGVPALAYHWNFGDGTISDGADVSHTFTRAGQFEVHLLAEGIEGLPFENTLSVTVTGEIDTRFTPSRNRRYQEH